jgi:hypothetical protein
VDPKKETYLYLEVWKIDGETDKRETEKRQIMFAECR